MIPQVDLFSFVLWKNLKTPKRHFEINWPLACALALLWFLFVVWKTPEKDVDSKEVSRKHFNNIRTKIHRDIFSPIFSFIFIHFFFHQHYTKMYESSYILRRPQKYDEIFTLFWQYYSNFKKKVWRFRQILKTTLSECMNLTSIWRKRNIYQGYRKVWKFGERVITWGPKIWWGEQ